MSHECTHCNEPTIWWHDRMIIPDQTSFQPPNEDMPEDIKSDYLEAASISARSPRGAAAILRLCVQNLCTELGFGQSKLDDAIAAMVSAGLPTQVLNALDVVRVIGNNAVHPGRIDISDDQDAVAALAQLVNLIVEDRISKPRHISENFDKLPQSIKDAIAARNARASGGA